MALLKRITDDMKSALRAGDRSRLQVLRTLMSAITYDAKVNHQEPDDELVRIVLTRESRRREEAIKILVSGGRDDKAADERSELNVIADYLPPAVDTSAIEAAAREVIDETGATGPSDMGRVMGPLIDRLRAIGTVDGKVGSATVRALLSGS